MALNTWGLNRPMASSISLGADGNSSHHPSFIRVPPPLLSIGIKDAFHRSLLRQRNNIPLAKGCYTERGFEVVPFSLIDDRIITRPVCEKAASKLSTYKILGPGMIILENYVSIKDQVDIVKICEKWAAGPGGFYIYQSDADLRRQMCFGRNWEPETRYENAYRSNGFKPPPIPSELISLTKAAIQDAQILLDELPSMCPDTCLVSFYQSNYRVGLHQDLDESSDSLKRGLPVVSISIGFSAEFVYGHSRDKRKLKRVFLDSGDVLIFGGKSRLIYHGVPHVCPCTSHLSLFAESGLRTGRLSLTLRQSEPACFS